MSGNFKCGVVVWSAENIMWSLKRLCLPLMVPLEDGDVLYHLHLNGLVQCFLWHSMASFWFISVFIKFKRFSRMPRARERWECQMTQSCFLPFQNIYLFCHIIVWLLFAKQHLPCCSSSLFLINEAIPGWSWNAAQ